MEENGAPAHHLGQKTEMPSDEASGAQDGASSKQLCCFADSASQ